MEQLKFSDLKEVKNYYQDKISASYFSKISKKYGSDIDGLVEFIESKVARDQRREEGQKVGTKASGASSGRKRSRDPNYVRLQKYYKISTAMFHKYKTMADGDIDVLLDILKGYEERKKCRSNGTPRAPKKKRVAISSGVYVPHKIEIPDHVMSKDEFNLKMFEYAQRAVYRNRGKYYTLAQNNIDSEDLAMDVYIKCVRDTRDGKKRYEEYLQDPENKAKSLGKLANETCLNHFKDFLKCEKWRNPAISMETPMPGSEDLTLADSIGVEDKDNTPLTEYIEKCKNIKIKAVKARGQEGNPDEVSLDVILKSLLKDIPFTIVCKTFKVSPNSVRKAFLENGIEDAFGRALSNSYKSKLGVKPQS